MANVLRWTLCENTQDEECNHFDSLCDDLLTEVLLLLPNYKVVIQSTCVCKRWASLASHPFFIPKFIALKLGDLYKEHTFAFVMQHTPDNYCGLGQGFDNFFRPSIFDAQASSFSPLSSYLGDDVASKSDVGFASCKDLLLYWKIDNYKYDFYISNVQTRHCVALPSPPHDYGKVNLVGFICDTFFSFDKEIIINPSYHYSVVFIHCKRPRSTELRARIFSSRCHNQWCNKVLVLPKECHILPPGPSYGFSFCFDGKLYFSCLQGIFGFEHRNIDSNDEIQCHLVAWPVGMLRGNHRVDVSYETLHLSNYCYDTSAINVWVYKEGDWMLRHRVYAHEWVSSHSLGVSKTFKMYKIKRVLGFHPWCSDVIYVVIPGHIFLCNLATKTVELACCIPIAKRYKDHLNNFYGLPVIFQSVPTPLPQLAHRP